jgi:hypothetical protein
MRIHGMAGLCLIIFGVINVLQEIALTSSGRGKPGLGFALITSVMFTAGAALLWRDKIRKAFAKSRQSKMSC